MNDGRKVDPDGNFWAGSMVENANLADGAKGKLYRLQPDGTVSEHLDNIQISNSICFSLEGEALYFTDTPTHQIERFNPIESGELGQRQSFARLKGAGSPDGSTLDSTGYLWNAEWGEARTLSFNQHAALPVSQPTCPAFGGPALDHLFVTSAREALDDAKLTAEPDAGKVIILKGCFRGVATPKFALK